MKRKSKYSILLDSLASVAIIVLVLCIMGCVITRINNYNGTDSKAGKYDTEVSGTITNITSTDENPIVRVYCKEHNDTFNLTFKNNEYMKYIIVGNEYKFYRQVKPGKQPIYRLEISNDLSNECRLMKRPEHYCSTGVKENVNVSVVYKYYREYADVPYTVVYTVNENNEERNVEEIISQEEYNKIKVCNTYEAMKDNGTVFGEPAYMYYIKLNEDN